MADENFEYKLKEEGEGFLGGQFKGTIGPGMSFFAKYKKFLIPLGLIIAIILVYKILFWFTSSPNQPEVKREPQQVVNKVEPSVPTPVTPTASQLIEQQSSAMKQQVDALSQQVQTTQSTVASFDDAINQNKNDIQNLTQTVNTLNASVQDLTKNMQVMYSMVKKPTKAKRGPRVYVKKISYHVKAIVPGRVWLESSEGLEVSLKVGDKLNSYGKVTDINPKDGTVIMSNGKTFSYGINDH